MIPRPAPPARMAFHGFPAQNQLAGTLPNPTHSPMTSLLLPRAALVAAVAWLLAATPLATAAEAPETGRPIAERLLKAIEANDHESFVTDAGESFRANLTKEALQAANTQVGPRLKPGYDLGWFGELRQQGCQVLLWKVTFKDGGDDALVRLVLKDGKVMGFWLQ